MHFEIKIAKRNVAMPYVCTADAIANAGSAFYSSHNLSKQKLSQHEKSHEKGIISGTNRLSYMLNSNRDYIYKPSPNQISVLKHVLGHSKSIPTKQNFSKKF